MKKVIVLLLFLACICIAYATVTETPTVGTKSLNRGHYRNSASNFSMIGKVSIAFEATDLDSTVTEALDSFYGIVYRIVGDSSGTDTDYDVLLRDESDKTIFTKEGLTSASEPWGYAVYEDDTEGNPWAGVLVGGGMDLVITGAAGLDGLTIHIYYLDFWK